MNSSKNTLPLRDFLIRAGLPKWSLGLITRILNLAKLEEVYALTQANSQQVPPPSEFCAAVLKNLGVTYHLPEERIQEFKTCTGPLVFIANHPLGGLDALILMVLMEKARSSFRFMGNDILQLLPELKERLLPVDIRDQSRNRNKNASEILKLLRYLKSGGTLGVFPAGQVASRFTFTAPFSREHDWSVQTIRLIRLSKANVVPVYFQPNPRIVAQILGLILPKLRIALLTRELTTSRREVKLKVGPLILNSELQAHESEAALSIWLQTKVFSLSNELT